MLHDDGKYNVIVMSHQRERLLLWQEERKLVVFWELIGIMGMH
jgi:hypothetical protein